jgi:hypothetical protein
MGHQGACQGAPQMDFVNHRGTQGCMQRLELAKLKRALITRLHDRPSQDPQRDLRG